MKSFKQILIKNRNDNEFKSHHLKLVDGVVIENSAEEYKNQFLEPNVFHISKIQTLINALKVIKNWDDETEDEWEDPGYVADHALKKWKINPY